MRRVNRPGSSCQARSPILPAPLTLDGSDPSPLFRFQGFTEAGPPQVALVLGSGLGCVANRLDQPNTLPFIEVPGLSAVSVEGHKGCMTLGNWAGKRVLVFEGRLHSYEGFSWRSITEPVKTAAFLGAKIILFTNAAGGILDAFVPGSLMAIRDHIEWNRPYCWRHPGPGSLGNSRPSPYSQRLLDLLEQAAAPCQLNRGMYAAVTGPAYETPAEIRALRAWGADAVGMSTTREVQAGFDLGLECAAISCITNRAAGLGEDHVNHKDVLNAAATASKRLADLLETFLSLL